MLVQVEEWRLVLHVDEGMLLYVRKALCLPNEKVVERTKSTRVGRRAVQGARTAF
jgi:hypothetical protein